MATLRNDVLLLGTAGSSGRLIAAELAARGLSVRLAGRRRGPLEDLARALATDGATTDVRTVDVTDAASLAEAITGVGVVLSTIGPFARQAGAPSSGTGSYTWAEAVGAPACHQHHSARTRTRSKSA